MIFSQIINNPMADFLDMNSLNRVNYVIVKVHMNLVNLARLLRWLVSLNYLVVV